MVIANLGSIDPWRQARAIANQALEGDKRLKTAPLPITEAEIKPLAGTYVSADTGATWRIARQGEDWTVAVSGPLIAGGTPWPVRGIDADTVEIETPGSWMAVTQLAHLVRDRPGRVVALDVSTGRIKKMRFERRD